MYNFRRYFLLLCLTLVAISAFLVVNGRVTFPGMPGPDFDNRLQTTHIENISKLQPDLVLLGDSIVDENVDASLLSQDLGLNAYPMSFGGSASALWYLALKNNILAASHTPKYVVIIFRDSTLTAPGYRVQGKFGAVLDELALPTDASMLQRAFTPSMNPLEMLAERYFPPYEYRLTLRSFADMHVYGLPHLMRCNKRCVDSALLKVFNFKNAAPTRGENTNDLEEYMLYSPDALNFDAQVEGSFLPEILRLCNERGIQLIFVRAKTARFADPADEPAGLEAYLASLQSYLAENGALYVDISSSLHVNFEDFVDNFHVFPSARARYTEMLAQGLRTVLP